MKRWRYSFWGTLTLYECPKCNKKFRYHLDSTDKRKSFVVRLGAYTQTKNLKS